MARLYSLIALAALAPLAIMAASACRAEAALPGETDHGGAEKTLRFTLSGPGQPGFVSVSSSRAYRGDYGYEPQSKPGDRLFSVAVPEGTYRVSVQIAGSDPLTIKAESRRLMLLAAKAASGNAASFRFLVHIRRPELAPRPPMHRAAVRSAWRCRRKHHIRLG